MKRKISDKITKNDFSIDAENVSKWKPLLFTSLLERKIFYVCGMFFSFNFVISKDDLHPGAEQFKCELLSRLTNIQINF